MNLHHWHQWATAALDNVSQFDVTELEGEAKINVLFARNTLDNFKRQIESLLEQATHTVDAYEDFLRSDIIQPKVELEPMEE